MKKSYTLIIFAIIIAIMGSPFYTIDETEQVVITMFGEAVGKPVNDPGLKIKLPFIQKVNRLPKNLLEWDGDKGQVITSDKTFVLVDAFGRWKISDPLSYLEQVRSEGNAQRILDGILDPAVRNLVTSNSLIEVVRNTSRQMVLEQVADSTERDAGNTEDSMKVNITLGRDGMCKAIMAQAVPKLQPLGIELVDLQFKRINYADEVLRNVYERMIAERRQKAEKYRSEGRGDSTRISGKKEKALAEIKSEAYRKVEQIKGEADAKATRIYAAAYGRDPEFYTFSKTLNLYRESFDSSATVIMSTKNDLFRYFKSFK